MLTVCSSSFSQNIDFVDTVFAKRLNSLNLQLDLRYNEIIEQKIKQMVYVENDKVGKALGCFFQGKTYFDSLLKMANLPVELQYLPLALTQMGMDKSTQYHCAGVWQLPYFVAISYGLKIDEYMDERYDIRKATSAAIAYLQKLSENHVDLWDIIIAYANSVSALQSAKIKAQPNNTIWDLYFNGNLPDKEIIPDFITWVYLANFYQSHHIKLQYPAVNNNKTIYLQQTIPANIFISELEMSELYFYQCNPVLIGSSIPSHSDVYIPEEKVELFSMKEKTLYAISDSLKNQLKTADSLKSSVSSSSGTQTKLIYYTVKSGDVLGKIAQKNNTTVSQLKKWNNLKNDNISIGQRLIVRQSSISTSNLTNTSPAKTDTPKPMPSTKDNSNETIYVVQSGDILFQIANKYNVTVSQLKEWNDLKSDNIQVKQKLIIRPTTSKPAVNVSSSSTVKKITYTVKNGDTLSRIAKTYNVSIEDIKKWNNLKSDRIAIGQKLTINR